MPPQPTPRGQLMVVDANLQNGPRVNPNERELAAFARRLENILEHAPDVLLLQEVSSAAAQIVARRLNRQGFGRYRVTVRPTDLSEPTGPDAPEVRGDTAILLGASMERLASGRVLNSYDQFDRAGPRPVQTKVQSWVRARRRDGSRPIQLASVHLITNGWLNPENIGFCYKGRWSDEVADRLESVKPSASTLNVIAGDFNNRRCYDLPAKEEKVQCEAMPFWHRLTDRWGYRDAVFSVHGSTDEELQKQLFKGTQRTRRIDYIFTTGDVLDASHDITYQEPKGSPDFYSDHRFVWALLDLAEGAL